jgi:pyridoxamine 5'-phosphate oxidase family protein
MTFTEREREYLATQLIGRLATVAPDGTPQNNPVAFVLDAQAGTIDIGGYRMGATRKFRNVAATGRAALVVDDVPSVNPWQVRGVEIRGTAEALQDTTPPRPGFSREVIRIHPRRILSWGIDPDGPMMSGRDVETEQRPAGAIG